MKKRINWSISGHATPHEFNWIMMNKNKEVRKERKRITGKRTGVLQLCAQLQLLRAGRTKERIQ